MHADEVAWIEQAFLYKSWLRVPILADFISTSQALQDAQQDYRPFDQRARLAIQFAPIALIVLCLLGSALPAPQIWLPKRLYHMAMALSPLIQEKDLRATDIGRISRPTGMLRRGAILEQDGDSEQYSNIGFHRQQKKIFIFVCVSLVEAIASAVRFGWIQGSLETSNVDRAASFFAVASWLFITLYIWTLMPNTAPVFVLMLVLLHFADAAARMLDSLPHLAHDGIGSFLWYSSPAMCDALLSLILTSLILVMPVNAGGFEAQVPQRERERILSGEIVQETEDIRRDYELCPTTPEDYTSLISSLTYTWMEPVQRLSMKRPLLPSDIWRLRSINDTHLLSQKFSNLKYTGETAQSPQRSLTARLLLCNANDIALDMTYKLCAVTLAYAGPALMKAILQCISDAAQQDDNSTLVLTSSGFRRRLSMPIHESSDRQEDPQWTPRSKAFVLAVFSLAFTLVRYIAELKNFHHARQVGLRIRSALVIELFEKSLKRRLTSGRPANIVEQKSGQSRLSQDQEQSREEQTPSSISDASEENALLDKRSKSGKEKKRKKAALNETTPSSQDASQADVGKLVNMMASDINELLRLGCDSHQLYGAPLEVIIATTFLYRLLGPAALAGLSVLVLGLPLNYFVGRIILRMQRKYRAATDARISLVAELINAIRFIKIQGTQSKWIDRVMKARRREMRRLIWLRVNQYFFVLLWSGLPIASLMLTFYIYVVVQGNELTIPVAFTTLTLSTMLRSPLNILPAFAMSVLQATVSIKRLESFFKEPEVDDEVSSLKFKDSDVHRTRNDTTAMTMSNASFSWQTACATDATSTRPKVVLEDLSLDFPNHGLCVIEGPTASGKSSLLAALLGELQRICGSQNTPKYDATGRSLISFAAQSPWLEAGKSIKDNILFVTPFDQHRYEITVKACALQEDFHMFADGDDTRVSKETLSGGQKARISLARALYHRSHTVLLDDILSAVDTRVQRHIYEQALTGPIAQGRRVVLATHHVALVVPKTSYMVRLKAGRIISCGPTSQVWTRKDIDETSDSKGVSTSSVTREKEEAFDAAAGENAGRVTANGTSHTAKSDKDKTAQLLFELEARQEGNVRWKSYIVYLRAAPMAMWVLILSFGILLRLNVALEQYWLKLWGESYRRPAWNFPNAGGHELFYIGIYGVIGFTQVILLGMRHVVFWVASYIASKRIYRRMLFTVVRARMRFFDRNPAGRILQRFNMDIGVVDSELPQNAMNFIANLLAFLSLTMICFVIVPAFSVPVVLGIIFAIWGIRGFLKTTMYMQRIESTSTSPMYTAFTQIIEGLMTVRAYGAEAYFLDRMQTITSITSAQWWAICTIEIWLSFRAQMISGLSVFLATTLALSGAVSPGSAGMVISSSALLTSVAYNLSHDYKVLSNNGNSVERVKEYMDLDQEAPEMVLGNRMPAAWPSSSGGIEVQNLSLRYDKSFPEVLHSISFSIKPREKIAIVGRTGSGKTSFVSAFMRSVEPSSTESAIIVDGLDIMKLGLEYRTRISVVPQDPILFSGTIRQNLDPFEEKSDEECQWALDRVGINRQLEAIPTDGQAGRQNELSTPTREPVKLSTRVEAGSSNLSAGQAQLVCLARALLREARIVILDEATSSTDHETDSNIQRAIREMGESIIIAVAHRLSTVIDYDRILVMSSGKIVEYDSPKTLLSKREDDESAHFLRMCREAGPATFRHLRQAAGVPISQ